MALGRTLANKFPKDMQRDANAATPMPPLCRSGFLL
jgi:hypothetical protein